MDDRQLPEDLLDFNLEDLLNLSFDLDSLNSIDETSNQLLDELTSSIISENSEISLRNETLQEDRTADAYTKTVGDKQNSPCIDLEMNVGLEQPLNHVELITLSDTDEDNEPVSQPIVDLPTEDIALDSPWMENNHSTTKTGEPRIYLSKEELSVLEHEFQICHYPDRYTRKKLALALNLTQLKVSEWFTNRRIKMRKQLPVDFSTSKEYSGRAKRIMLSKSQLAMLESEFKKCQNPDCLARQKLALMLGLRDVQVNNWFQNRRAKMRKLIDYVQLPSLQTKFQQDFSEKTDINNNQLVTIKHTLEKHQSRYDAVYESVSTFNLTNQQNQEPKVETSSSSSSALSNQDTKQKISKKLVQLVQSQTETCSFSLSSGAAKRRRKRTNYCKSQLTVLERAFKKSQYPDFSTICQLASTIEVTEHQVRVWFKNQRSKQRNLQKQTRTVQSPIETVNLSVSSSPSTPKRKRMSLRKMQLMELEREFKKCQYPDLVKICQLASKIYVTNSQVRRWFTIRRAKQRILKKRGQTVKSQGKTCTKPNHRSGRIVCNRYATLEREFAICQYPERHTRERLALALNLTVFQVSKWFENRRTKMQKLRINSRSPRLKTDASKLFPSTALYKPKFRVQRTNFNEEHVAILENEFRKCQYPDYGTLVHLASIVNVPHIRINNWFRNRRTKQRKLENPPSTETPKPRRHRGKKTYFTASQLAILEHEFEQNQYLDYDTACSLATIINVPYHKVQTWFINRRAKLRQLNKCGQLSQLQTKTTSFSSSNKFSLMETQICNRQIQQFQHNHQVPSDRANNCNNTLSNSVQQTSVFPQNWRFEWYNHSTTSVFIQQDYSMTASPLIQEDAFYVNPTPPSAQYVFSHTYDASANSQNYIL